MKNIQIVIITFFLSFLISPIVLAGAWHKGYGGTIKEATNSANKKAYKAVKKRGKGCVDKSKKPVKKGEKWVVKVHQSYHNGSCGK